MRAWADEPKTGGMDGCPTTTQHPSIPPSAPPPAQSSRRRARRFAVAAAIVLAGLAVLGTLASWGIEWWCCATPPALGRRPAILDVPVQETGGARRIGPSWIAARQSVRYMYLEGDPFTLGYSNAMLTQELFEEQEAALLLAVKQYVPSRIGLWLLRKLVLVRNRDLPAYVSLPLQTEIYGLARGSRDLHPELGDLYTRLLNYHAAHDISHAFQGHPLVGCTSFAAWGPATRDGHLLVGRNFDFDAGRCFDENKIVIRVQPDTGHGFLSVAWPGMIGVVTGLNDARIAVAVNAAQSEDTRPIGTPVSLVLREVMQHASTLREAVAIIERSQVFVSDSYLVADGKVSQAVVVEKTPRRTAVRLPSGDHIICSNHFLTENLRDDPANVAAMAEGTTVARHERLEALVAGRTEPLTVADVAAFLRDRRVPGVPTPVLGHLAAINSLTATHSVIVDATAGTVWVSAAPHQTAAYVPFRLTGFGEPPGAAAIPPDGTLAGDSCERCVSARARLAEASRLLRRKEWQAAATPLREAATLNPDHYLPHLLLGRVAFEQGQWAEATRHLETARALYPAFGSEREMVRTLLRQCEAGEAQ
jgi:hypothetical protein